jgi:hypothetical protein
VVKDFADGERMMKRSTPAKVDPQNDVPQPGSSTTPRWQNRSYGYKALEFDTMPPIPQHFKSGSGVNASNAPQQEQTKKADPALVASSTLTPEMLTGQNGQINAAQTDLKTQKQETKPLDSTQDKKKLAWLSPLDALDYLGLGLDVLERAYIEIGMKPGQEKEFARFSNTLYFAIDAAMAILPGAGGGGLAIRASHEVGVAAWHALPASSKAKVIQELAKNMGWSATRASQAVNVFFSMKAGKGSGKDGKDGNKGGSNKRPADLPSSKKVKYDWDHIFEGHWEGTPAKTRGNNTVFWGLNKNQIKAVIQDAYKNIYKKVQTQGDKIRVRGKSGKWDIEMWVNKKTNQIETAYPREIRK